MRQVILMSGGVDSAYLAKFVERNALCLFVDYGQPARVQERNSAWGLAKNLMLGWAEVTVYGMPMGDMDDWKSGACVVPARNLWLTSLAAAFGDEVWIGCAPQDERDYEDCRLHFLEDLNTAMRSIGRTLRWSNAPRPERVEWLSEKNLLDMTWSCYGPGPTACEECASCRQ